jgi:hypothetical protein
MYVPAEDFNQANRIAGMTMGVYALLKNEFLNEVMQEIGTAVVQEDSSHVVVRIEAAVREATKPNAFVTFPEPGV